LGGHASSARAPWKADQREAAKVLHEERSMKRIQTTHRTGTRSPCDDTVIERQTLGFGARFLIDYIQMKEDPQRATHAWTIPGAGGRGL
jgi:hypothetical protein